MRLADVVDTSISLRETPARKMKVRLLAACVRQMEPAEVAVGVAYLCGSLPQGKIGLGWEALRKARGPASAEPSLTLRQLDGAFAELAALRGPGSDGERVRRLGAVFVRATAAEQEFLVGLILGELRQGASEGLVVEAVAAAAELPAAAVRRGLMFGGDLGAVAAAAIREGTRGLERFGLTLFQPVLPMLAQPARDMDAVFERHGQVAFEWKLDGARIQVHKREDEVRVFSRRLNDVTVAVPEVVEAVRGLSAREQPFQRHHVREIGYVRVSFFASLDGAAERS